jgi:hypothetical protein
VSEIDHFNLLHHPSILAPFIIGFEMVPKTCLHHPLPTAYSHFFSLSTTGMGSLARKKFVSGD